jgi:hypothetical protein
VKRWAALLRRPLVQKSFGEQGHFTICTSLKNNRQKSCDTSGSGKRFVASISNKQGIYFSTITVEGWVDVFTRDIYREALLESIRF